MQLNENPQHYISVIIPVFNEEENVIPLAADLVKVLERMDTVYEVIFIDDGSTDSTFANLKKIRQQYLNIRIVKFTRNFGQSAAMQAGFDLARNEIIITMDGDRQNDPEDIPALVEKLEEGFDIVSGFRQDRKEGMQRRFPSRVANWILRKLTDVPLHDTGCTLKAYQRKTIKQIQLYGEQHRFIPILASQYGAQVTEIPVKHYPREAGKSKYGLSRTHRVFLDILMLKFMLSYATRPLQIFGMFGMASFSGGFIVSAYLTVRKFQGYSLSERPLLLLAILLMILGVQFVSIGLLAEMISRTYHEAARKPIYAVKEFLDSRKKTDER